MPVTTPLWKSLSGMARGAFRLAPPDPDSPPRVNTDPIRTNRSEHIALFALCLGVIGIAWAGILFRLSEVGPIATAFWRVALAFPLLILWRFAESRKDSATRRSAHTDLAATGTVSPGPPGVPPHGPASWLDGRLGLFAAGAFFAGDLAFWHWSLTWTTVANATLFANAAPLYVTLAGWALLGRRFSRRFLWGLGLAVLGAGLLMGASLRLGPQNLVGDLLAMVTALFLAAYLLAVERLRLRHSTATIMAWNAGAGAVLLLPLALVLEDALLPATAAGWLALAALALVSHVLGQSLIAFSMARLPAAFTAVSLLMQPVLAALFAWVVLGEALGPLQLLGGAVILCGILLARGGSRPVHTTAGAETAGAVPIPVGRAEGPP